MGRAFRFAIFEEGKKCKKKWLGRGVHVTTRWHIMWQRDSTAPWVSDTSLTSFAARLPLLSYSFEFFSSLSSVFLFFCLFLMPTARLLLAIWKIVLSKPDFNYNQTTSSWPLAKHGRVTMHFAFHSVSDSSPLSIQERFLQSFISRQPTLFDQSWCDANIQIHTIKGMIAQNCHTVYVLVSPDCVYLPDDRAGHSSS